MFITFKETVWSRISIPKEKEAEVKKLLEDGKINSVGGLSDIVIGGRELLLDTFEPLDAEKDNGWATIEAYDEDGETIYANGKTYIN